MREISREEHELIFNMFIMAFIYGLEGYSIDHIDDEEWFKLCMKGGSFRVAKLCFPMDEVCYSLMFRKFGTSDIYRETRNYIMGGVNEN